MSQQHKFIARFKEGYDFVVVGEMLMNSADRFSSQFSWNQPSDITQSTLRLRREPLAPDVWCQVEDIAIAVHMTEEDVVYAFNEGNLWARKRTENVHWTSLQQLHDVKTRYHILPPVLNTSHFVSPL